MKGAIVNGAAASKSISTLKFMAQTVSKEDKFPPTLILSRQEKHQEKGNMLLVISIYAI